MAGTMMKTSSRVKSTVKEMPRRLTIRLSKGSNRNMVEVAGQACALLSTHEHSLQTVPSDSISLGKEVSPPLVTDSMSKFTSSNCLHTGLERGRMIVEKATGASPEMLGLPRTDSLCDQRGRTRLQEQHPSSN